MVGGFVVGGIVPVVEATGRPGVDGGLDLVEGYRGSGVVDIGVGWRKVES